MNLALQIIGTVLSLTHIVLNIFKKRACWLFNAVALCVWIWLYARLNLPIVIGLMCVYITLSIWGWHQWKEK